MSTKNEGAAPRVESTANSTATASVSSTNENNVTKNNRWNSHEYGRRGAYNTKKKSQRQVTFSEEKRVS